MAQTQVILLERIESLGDMGDTVNVRPGYARNYLLPRKKALRATSTNKAYFEAQRKQLEAENEKKRKEAEKVAKKLKGLKVPLIRQASEAGQLFGSVTARDIAREVSEVSKEKIERHMVQLNQNYKLIGLFPVDVILHPEVKIQVIINIARTVEEAQTQAKTGKALIVEEGTPEAGGEESDEAQLEEVLEEGALEAEKQKKQAAMDTEEETAKKKEAEEGVAMQSEERAAIEAVQDEKEEKPKNKAAKKAEGKE